MKEQSTDGSLFYYDTSQKAILVFKISDKFVVRLLRRRGNLINPWTRRIVSYYEVFLINVKILELSIEVKSSDESSLKLTNFEY